jgi:hypothetical protein
VAFSWDFLPLIINDVPYTATPIPNASINDINNALNNAGQPAGQMTGSQNSAAILATSGGQVTPLPFPAPGDVPALWGPGYNGPIVASTQGNAINLNGDIAATATLASGAAPGNEALRAYLVYNAGQFGGFGGPKFVDLHTPLTTIGYMWSNAMDVTDRNSQGGFSVVGVGDQGPWLITLTAEALSGPPSCLCAAPWNLPALNSAINPLYPASIRINKLGNMALTWNNDLWFADMTMQQSVFPRFLQEVLPENVEYALVQSFNDNRVFLLENGGMWSPPPSANANNWMNSMYQFQAVGVTLATTHKRLMNNNGDVLSGPAFDTPLAVRINSSGIKTPLTQYFTSFNSNPTPVAINDGGQIVCFVPAATTSVLLTP